MQDQGSLDVVLAKINEILITKEREKTDQKIPPIKAETNTENKSAEETHLEINSGIDSVNNRS